MITDTLAYLNALFDETTMSVHLQVGKQPLSKKWKPGDRELVKRGKEIESTERNELLQKLLQQAAAFEEAFMEIDRPSSKVIQFHNYRIVVVVPPVTKIAEMTIVRPLMKLSLSDYTLPPTLVDDLLHKWHWILIAWAPGEGKSTFAQAFLEVLATKKLIIKTVEAPRDLQVPEHVTQYSFGHASHNEIRDILLLSRPDITIYDEVRNKDDFKLYADLRLAGIGLVGVMHATRAIDAVQRFLSMVDMGTLPQVIDTIISIKAGTVDEILWLKQAVKTPLGMTDDDLARPVIQVFSRITEQPLYEIYTYSDNVIVMPVEGMKTGPWGEAVRGIDKYAKQTLEMIFKQRLGIPARIEVTGSNSIDVYVADSFKPRLIGKKWAHINKLEQELWVRIHVADITAYKATPQESTIAFEINERQQGRKGYIEIVVPKQYAHKDVECVIGETVVTLIPNHMGIITIKRKTRVEAITQWQFAIVGVS